MIDVQFRSVAVDAVRVVRASQSRVAVRITCQVLSGPMLNLSGARLVDQKLQLEGRDFLAVGWNLVDRKFASWIHRDQWPARKAGGAVP